MRKILVKKLTKTFLHNDEQNVNCRVKVHKWEFIKEKERKHANDQEKNNKFQEKNTLSTKKKSKIREK